MSAVKLVTIGDDGAMGMELATAHHEGAGVGYYGNDLLQVQIQTLARAYGRTEAEMLTLLAAEGWSNGKISIVGTEN